jgi:hypothetical protein
MKSHKNQNQYKKNKIKALADEIKCDIDEIYESDSSAYGLDVYGGGRAEFAVATNDEANKASENYIRDSILAFNATFILSCCELPFALRKAIESYQKEECENANEPLLELVEKTCGIKKFAEKAIQSDGRGHFLATYDGQERERNGIFIYRIG